MYMLLGAGGHAKVIIDILKANNEEIYGVLDDNPDLTGKFINGIEILGLTEKLSIFLNDNPDLKIIVSVGDNFIRKKIVSKLEESMVKFGTAIHPSAVIGSKVLIGSGTVVMPNAVINSNAKIGKHAIINTGATVDHDCILEDYVHISPGAHLSGNVQVMELSHIGVGACVIPGQIIGSDSIVGAGGVVINNIENSTVVVGCPAKFIKRNIR